MKTIKKAGYDRLFSEAMGIANGCAHEGLFSSLDRSGSGNDCGFCPAEERCAKFWYDFVCNDAILPDYLETVRRQFERFRRRKARKAKILRVSAGKA